LKPLSFIAPVLFLGASSFGDRLKDLLLQDSSMGLQLTVKESSIGLLHFMLPSYCVSLKEEEEAIYSFGLDSHRFIDLRQLLQLKMLPPACHRLELRDLGRRSHLHHTFQGAFALQTFYFPLVL